MVIVSCMDDFTTPTAGATHVVERITEVRLTDANTVVVSLENLQAAYVPESTVTDSRPTN